MGHTIVQAMVANLSDADLPKAELRQYHVTKGFYIVSGE